MAARSTVKRFSQVSTQALNTLTSLTREIDVFEGRLAKYETFEAGDDPTRAIQDLRQLSGNLDKLQFERVDAVCTGELNSGKAEAKDNRRL